MLDDEPDIEYLIVYTPPIPRGDLNRIQDMLRTADPLVPSVKIQDPYEVATYLPSQMVHREKFCLLVDRNVVSRWTGALRGQEITPAHRTAAAIQAFAQCADFLVEPNLAFYELHSTTDDATVGRELQVFRAADNLPATNWADIALGRSQGLRVKSKLKPPTHSPELFGKPLYRWRRNYILALKIAELHLQGGKSMQLMDRLMRWMYDEFAMGGAALQLASYYFAPGAPRHKLLKNIRSDDRLLALAGVRNAAWDLTLISEWMRRTLELQQSTTSEPVSYMLCTFDKGVRRMARSMISFDDTASDADEIRRLLSNVWGAKNGDRLAVKLHEYYSTLDNPLRQFHRPSHDDFIDELIAVGEAAITRWAPSR